MEYQNTVENIKQEIYRLNDYILGIYETSWTNNDDFVTDRETLIFMHTGIKRMEGRRLITTFQEIFSVILSNILQNYRVILKEKRFNVYVAVEYATKTQNTEVEIERQCSMQSSGNYHRQGNLSATVGNESYGQVFG